MYALARTDSKESAPKLNAMNLFAFRVSFVAHLRSIRKTTSPMHLLECQSSHSRSSSVSLGPSNRHPLNSEKHVALVSLVRPVAPRPRGSTVQQLNTGHSHQILTTLGQKRFVLTHLLTSTPAVIVSPAPNTVRTKLKKKSDPMTRHKMKARS